MSRMGIVVVAVLLIGLIELAAVREARGTMLITCGIPVALAFIALVWSLREHSVQPDTDPGDIENGPAEMLHHWHARAEMLADRADGTRADWDRHLRPLLAKEFELSTGMRVAKNRKATEAAGVLQFGPELWLWVDPANSALRDQTTRAPGRAALDEILRRLQRM
ncbi:hypothetical protein [Nocardia australiensis]|uniref:hypothetical protein n=1 Tax=Nocardia australiensis TaxID=2887191 RepID=UPI001D14E997|nr:hypothetical protein [Nocardia australiensis]